MNQESKQKLEEITPYCYSTTETKISSYNLAKYVTEDNIEGDIVECGIAAGGNFAAMMVGNLEYPNNKKIFWGFDSFEGIQLAGKKDTVQAGIGDIKHNTDVPYELLMKTSGVTSHNKESVINNLKKLKLYDKLDIRLIEGWVQNTITDDMVKQIGKISILRLDMDIYHPTKHVLEKLYPIISDGGVIIIDDWALDGVRIACEEFFKENNINPKIHTVSNSTPTFFFKKNKLKK